jgi:hypothetical protein
MLADPANLGRRVAPVVMGPLGGGGGGGEGKGVFALAPRVCAGVEAGAGGGEVVVVVALVVATVGGGGGDDGGRGEVVGGWSPVLGTWRGVRGGGGGNAAYPAIDAASDEAMDSNLPPVSDSSPDDSRTKDESESEGSSAWGLGEGCRMVGDEGTCRMLVTAEEVEVLFTEITSCPVLVAPMGYSIKSQGMGLLLLRFRTSSTSLNPSTVSPLPSSKGALAMDFARCTNWSNQ